MNANGTAVSKSPVTILAQPSAADDAPLICPKCREPMFGPGATKRIVGLNRRMKEAEARASELEAKLRATREENRAAYKRGQDDARAEIVFAERLAAVRQRYPDFDVAWRDCRPLVPRGVFEEIAEMDDGLEAAYFLAKNAAVCEELSSFSPEEARKRFRYFAADLKLIREAK